MISYNVDVEVNSWRMLFIPVVLTDAPVSARSRRVSMRGVTRVTRREGMSGFCELGMSTHRWGVYISGIGVRGSSGCLAPYTLTGWSIASWWSAWCRVVDSSHGAVGRRGGGISGKRNRRPGSVVTCQLVNDILLCRSGCVRGGL
jgi:hypothetical protein